MQVVFDSSAAESGDTQFMELSHTMVTLAYTLTSGDSLQASFSPDNGTTWVDITDANFTATSGTAVMVGCWGMWRITKTGTAGAAKVWARYS